MPAVDAVLGDVDDKPALGQPLAGVGRRLGLVFDYEDSQGLESKKAPDFSAFLRSASPKSSSSGAPGCERLSRRNRRHAASRSRRRPPPCGPARLRNDLAEIEGSREAVEVPGDFLGADLRLTISP